VYVMKPDATEAEVAEQQTQVEAIIARVGGILEKTDPWGRLGRTARYVATTVYGTTAQAREAGRRVRALHARMRAVDPRTGEPYRIDEPDLLRWVHVTEVESFATVAVQAGVPLAPAELDRYHDEQRRVAELVGLDPATVPASAAAVRRYYRDIRPELALGPDGITAARFLTSPPLPYRLGFTPVRLVYLGAASLAVGLLPRWARRLYGLPGLPTTDVSASATVRALRAALALLPDRFAQGPIYQAAMARADAARAG